MRLASTAINLWGRAIIIEKEAIKANVVISIAIATGNFDDARTIERDRKDKADKELKAEVGRRVTAKVCVVCGGKFGLLEKGVQIWPSKIGVYYTNDFDYALGDVTLRVHTRCEERPFSK